MIVSLLALAALCCVLAGVWLLRQALAVTSTATSYIRSAAQGYVVLEGAGSPISGHTISAPFSGKPCVWWSTIIEPVFAGSGSSRKPLPNPAVFDKRTSSELFLLKDGTGECRVDPAFAEVHALIRDVWYGSSLGIDSIRESYLSRNIESEFRYIEERIELHQRIVASGYFRTLDESDGAQGRINTLTQPMDGRKLMLSTVPEDKLAHRLRTRAILAMSLGVALAACAFYAGISSG